MAASLLANGYGSLTTSHTAAAPAVLWDSDGLVATADTFHGNVFTVNNLDGTNWLWVQVQGLHFKGTAVSNVAIPVLPGTSLSLQCGFQDSRIGFVRGWATSPNAASTGTAQALNVAGGLQGVK